MFVYLVESIFSGKSTHGDLFYLMVDELSDLSFLVAFKQLIELFQKISADKFVLDDETLNNIISKFLNQLPKNYQSVF
ncbi:hypothetical protein [Pilibacter termitis]|uniref:hypothetical protein n=1 Tax=Pilibacter termitis TaxID=263852 RepID=UPI001186834C|nr:hypothetical protein [Pilibacter termitis]